MHNRPWTPDENAKLKQAVDCSKGPNGLPDWAAIEKIVGKPQKQCADHYYRIKAFKWSAETAKGIWSAEDDLKLKQAVENNKRPDGQPDWLTIAEQFFGKSYAQCINRYYRIHCRPWTADENRKLEQAVQTNQDLYGCPNWGAVAELVGRTDKQCSDQFKIIQALKWSTDTKAGETLTLNCNP